MPWSDLNPHLLLIHILDGILVIGGATFTMLMCGLLGIEESYGRTTSGWMIGVPAIVFAIGMLWAPFCRW